MIHGHAALLRHALKSAVLPALQSSGVLYLMSRQGRDGLVAVLNYHNVDPVTFRAHAAFLKRECRVVSLDCIVGDAREVRKNGLTVGLSFDDGYASFVDHIVPILSAAGLPATWFVPTSLVGTSHVFWFDRLRLAVLLSRRRAIELAGRTWRLHAWNREHVAVAISAILKKTPAAERPDLVAALVEALGEPPASALARCRITTPEQLSSLDPTLFGVGSHSHTHPQLSHLAEPELTMEARTSKTLLEGWTGRPVRHFAFPSGDYDRDVIRTVRSAGYAFAWTTEPRFLSTDSDPHRLPRVPVDDRASVAVLAAKLTPLLHRWGLVR